MVAQGAGGDAHGGLDFPGGGAGRVPLDEVAQDGEPERMPQGGEPFHLH